MKILALEPYYGGSHRAFLESGSGHSRHDWTVLGLPAHQWKWRMRHSAITLAEQVRERLREGETFDLLFCSDMLNLAEFKGLIGPPIAHLPAVAYFHENQLTYPVRHEDERDLHLGMINISTALAADRVWFNSAFHRDSFLGAIEQLTKRMPDHNRLVDIETILTNSDIQPQGIATPTQVERSRNEIPVILWVGRWEHDKNPAMFFDAITALNKEGRAFRISVIGEQFSDIPPEFGQAHSRFEDIIVRWGYQTSREDYERALGEADIIVSTADHEFFGVAVMEAVAAGAFPLLPDRLAYPELFGPAAGGSDEYFYDGGLDHLVTRLGELAARHTAGDLWEGPDDAGTKITRSFYWENLAPRLDDALDGLHRK